MEEISFYFPLNVLDGHNIHFMTKIFINKYIIFLKKRLINYIFGMNSKFIKANVIT